MSGASASGGAPPTRVIRVAEHIRREEFGIEGPLASEVSGLRRRQNARLARALARLGEQLYADSYHWQLELLQNADDCDYAQGVEPHVEFVVGPGSEVIVRTNELGVTPEDVCSLCDIGNSTKPTRRAGGGAHIGEKGLGFKAVFAVSDRPQLFSGPVAIAFDAAHPSGLGYILPEWLSDDVSRSGAGATGSNGWTTSLVLPLRQALRCRVADVARRLGELPAATLLFLRRVRRIAVVSEAGHPAHSCLRLALARPRAPTPLQDAEEATVVVEANGERRHERWLVVQLRVPVPDGVERPGGSTPHTTFLEAACPLTSSGAFDAERGPQPVFAHLPVGPPLGSAVALQGDWALASSREALLEGHPWNDLLLEALPDRGGSWGPAARAAARWPRAAWRPCPTPRRCCRPSARRWSSWVEGCGRPAAC
ncbi:unnamed protein product [Prorocentrum cordatum]|uniref:Protein NO VEIN C-terminal domain-containing protein n=1 Tax=Prorocentrum cordatum TaxID=2364126 RepID=A0ABN9PFP5_9DINO|nr:unnamed protein product [Polarella glacialis]